jgi:hypothetical protein
MSRQRLLPIVAGLLLVPATAFANAGTPLMMVSGFHLFIENALLGILEGALLTGLFKCSFPRTILILIPANYVSAWFGLTYLIGYFRRLPDLTILTAQHHLVVFFVAAFLTTLLIEFPFFWFALRKGERPFRRALVATPAVHLVSYTLLVIFYWNSSRISMLTELSVVAPGEIRSAESYNLYYLSPDSTQLLKTDLSGTQAATAIREVPSPHPNNRLFALQNDKATFDLHLHQESEIENDTKSLLLLEAFSRKAPIDLENYMNHSRGRGTWANFGEVPSLAAKSDWVFFTDFWPAWGISAFIKDTKEQRTYAVELPFAFWTVRNAVHLEGDLIVFQLGADQICLMDFQSKKIALIARGKGPMVARPNPF